MNNLDNNMNNINRIFKKNNVCKDQNNNRYNNSRNSRIRKSRISISCDHPSGMQNNINYTNMYNYNNNYNNNGNNICNNYNNISQIQNNQGNNPIYNNYNNNNLRIRNNPNGAQTNHSVDNTNVKLQNLFVKKMNGAENLGRTLKLAAIKNPKKIYYNY